MMDVILDAYDLEESIRIDGGPRLLMLPFVRKAIEMMLHDDKDRVLEYLKLARQVERLYQEVPDWYEVVLTSRFGPQPFHGLLGDGDNEDDRDRRSCSHEDTCDEEQGFEERDRDQHAYSHYEDQCKLDKRETCDKELDLEGKDYDCHHEDHCKRKRRERCTEEGCDREETWNEEHTFKGKDQNTQGCNREETCDEERGLKGKDQDTQRCNREETSNKECGLKRKIKIYTIMTKTKIITNSQRVLEIYKSYVRNKDYCKHKRRNQCRALHGCTNEKAHDGSHDGEKGWD